MRLEFTCGQLRVEANAGRGIEQFHADVKINAAARPRTLIARVVLDDDHRRTWGNKGPGRCANGWHVARKVGPRRAVAIVYGPSTGLPVSERQLTAPAYRWWPQVQNAMRGGTQ